MHWLSLALLAVPALAQSCQGTLTYSPCDFPFDAAPGQPLLRAEFKSPHFKTFLMPAFQDGARQIVRFSPTEAGVWVYRLSNGQQGQFLVNDSESPGFVHVANVHHFQTDNNKPHLWMSTEIADFLRIPRAEFDARLEARAKEKFTHLRVTLPADPDWSEAAERIRAIHAKGIVTDLAFAAIPEDWKAREQFLTNAVARFSAFNLTWAGLPAFERTPGTRALLKEAGALLKKLDPYQHPRTTMAEGTSGGLLADGWMDMIGYGTVDENIGAVEHQFFQNPALASGIRDSHDLWNATMNGQYPAGGEGQMMTVWRDFMASNRYWELEPYFDLDGGRALALEGVEYIVYIEKPAGPVEVNVEHHGYDVVWINPSTGERIKAKDYRGERFTGEPPDATHDWILRISREGEKTGMLKSVKFVSREVPLQEITLPGEKPLFDVTEVEDNEVSMSSPPKVSLKPKRETRATRFLLIEWTAEVAASGMGYRVVGTGKQATLKIPPSIAGNLPGTLSVHINLLNANGKAYEIDRVYRLVP